MFNILKKWLGGCEDSPKVKSEWEILSYTKYIDTSYGDRVSSVAYEATNGKQYISTYIYGSSLNKEQVKRMLDMGVKLGQKHHWR